MTVAVDGILRVVATFDIDNKSKMQNVYHCIHTTGTVQDEGDVCEAAAGFVDDVESALQGAKHTSVSGVDVLVYELTAGAWDPIGSFGLIAQGTNSSPRTSAGLACILTLRKPRTGFVDRKYYGGFTEGGIDGDEWGTSVLTAVGNAGAKLLVEYVDANGVKLTPCHFDRVAQTTKDYISTSPDNRVSYQRRRKPGVGLS